MRLLICTQAIDRNDPVLGFFHRWVKEFAKHFESIIVICLKKGEYDLPPNVHVYSLGKEERQSRIQYISRFIRYIVRFRREYDMVFVHMNPEYVALGGLLWRAWGKRVGLWYNHTVGSVLLRLARFGAAHIFHTSPFAYTARHKHAHQMPAGIDTELFKPHPEIQKIPRSIYFQGRVAPAKRVHVLLEAFADLHKKGEARLLTIVGPEDTAYTQPLKETYRDLIQSGAIIFKGPIPNTETPKLYAAHEVSVNLTDDGNYDKTVLESLACGTPVIVSSKAFKDAPVISISAPRAEELASALAGSYDTVQEPERYVRDTHGLPILARELGALYEKDGY